MDKMIYLIAIVLGLVAGLRFRRSFMDLRSAISRKVPDNLKDLVDSLKTKSQKKGKEPTKKKKDTRSKRRGLLGAIDMKFLAITVIVAIVMTGIMDMTYGYYISSYPWVLFWFTFSLIIGFLISLDPDVVRTAGPMGVAMSVVAVVAAVILPIILTFIHALVAIVVVLAIFIYMGRRAVRNPGRALMAIKGYSALFMVSILVVGIWNPMLHPEGVDNPLFDSLEDNETSAPQSSYITDLDEIRVISWDLATQYLQRAYGDSASTLATDPWTLAEDTDPTYVDGKFVWVDAPQFEAWKWLGGKDVPFFVYVVNEPEKMDNENPDIVHRVEQPLNTHKEKIAWKERVWNLAFDKYSGKYEVTQIRIDLDDAYQPHWIIYLSERGVIYNLPTLKKILIVSVEDIDDYEEFDIDDLDSIPDWLEVVYPDSYVYEWVDYWGSYRKGLVYSWFNKKHLYDPDDVAARFLIIQNQTYWQIPIRQKDSEVLGGFIQVDTRTGDAVFWNREAKSYVSKWTVEKQITSYLSSGEVGFQQLSIHEGYLYPLRTNDGQVREAYIFPLYAGFTVQKYAVVDAEYYTAAPYIDTSLEDVLERYRSRASATSNTTNLTWETHKIQNAFSEADTVVMTLQNESTFVVTEEDLKGGTLALAEDEWLELKLATAEHARTGNETIDVVLDKGKIVDVDYLEADLVEK